MEFTSFIFLFIFLPIFLLVYFLVKKRNLRNLILFIFSIFFYAWGEPIYIFLILFSIVINYYLAKLMVSKNSKLLYILVLIIDILTLVVFKYVPFLVTSVNSIFNLSIGVPNIALPIGISFYTFQIISYIVDVYHKRVNVQNNIIYLGCYIIAFPQLIAGPIVRYKTVEEEIENRKENWDMFGCGVRRFMIGLSKKVLIANVLGLISTQIFAQDAYVYGIIGAWVGMIFYTFQILFDFSGYSDMAIGIGKMLGFNYLENFDYPYVATSITDFWRRWHISLGSFFKDYVYIPLGGNRVKAPRFIFNILVVWALTGLWHGASVNFLLWGIYYGIILLIEKLVLKKYIDKLPNVIKHIYTLLLVIIGWVLFRSTSFVEIATILKAMFGGFGVGNINLFRYLNIFNMSIIIALILCILLATEVGKKIEKSSNIWISVIISILFILSILEIIIGSYNPFIYFRF